MNPTSALLLPCAVLCGAAPAAAQIAVCKPCDKDWNGECDPVIRRAGEDLPLAIDCGALTILYGTPAGVVVAGSESIDQTSYGGNNAARDNFGAATAAGDFNGDGFGDVAIGIPGKDGALGGEGAVVVLYGSANGILPVSAPGPQALAALANPAQAEAGFGLALAAGDLNGDAKDDLAIGIPLQNVGAAADAGAVEVLYGSALGLTAPEAWTQDSAGVQDLAENGDRFGSALAIGDFNDDGLADLAIGVPREDVGASGNAGAVAVLFGTLGGLTAFGDQFLTAGAGGAEAGAGFGSALADGDFDGSGAADLAIGVPSDDAGALADAGAVEVWYGGALGLGGPQLWTQDSAGVAGVGEAGDRFGRSLGAGDANGDGFADLAVGVPFEDAGAAVDAGSVNLLYGSAAGLTAAGNLALFSTVCGLEAGAQFGYDVTSADYDGDLIDDLLIGIPGDDLASGANSGSVEILYGLAGGGFGGVQCFNQETPGLASDGSQAGDRFGGGLEH